MFIAKGIAYIRKAWFIIDWHNFGYSILGMKLGMNHKVVRLAKWYEQRYGKTAFAHMCVTDAMHKELQDNWQVEGQIMTVRDKPQSDFKRLGLEQVHRQFTFSLKLIENLVKETADGEKFLGHYNDSKLGTLLTDAADDGSLIWRQDRPKLIVSSTSWTEDEDFSVLLKAVELYEASAKPSDPRLLFVITGNGPQKKYYQDKIKQMTLKKTRIVTAWLEAGDYPLLLGSADLGISLHTSSSGMDLPMKVVDMFGCGLPVCAINFPWLVTETRIRSGMLNAFIFSLNELVHDGENGLVFENSQDLSEQLMVIEQVLQKHTFLTKFYLGIICEKSQEIGISL